MQKMAGFLAGADTPWQRDRLLEEPEMAGIFLQSGRLLGLVFGRYFSCAEWFTAAATQPIISLELAGNRGTNMVARVGGRL